jgi:hypothetical protein
LPAGVGSVGEVVELELMDAGNLKQAEQGGTREMKKVLTLMMVVAVVALAFAPLAFAADVQGKVKAVDQGGRWVTLEDGLQLMIPTTVKVDRQALQPGAEVKVSYETQGNQNIVTTIQVRPATK